VAIMMNRAATTNNSESFIFIFLQTSVKCVCVRERERGGQEGSRVSQRERV
jgi:hypothetical protein